MVDNEENIRPVVEDVNLPADGAGALEAEAAAEEPMSVHPEMVIVTKKSLDEVLVVNKRMFYKLFRTLVTARGTNVTGIGAVRAIGQMLGAKTYDEEKQKWAEAQRYLEANP